MNAPLPHSGISPITEDSWQELASHTVARIALGRVGSSLPTRETLRFALAHAQARDAVHTPLDLSALSAALQDLQLPSLQVRSAAASRAAYLQRPDQGRRLHPDSRANLLAAGVEPCDVLFVIGDGLSARAVASHALPLLAATLPLLQQQGLRVGPVVLAAEARVALADEVGECLQAAMVVMLIGERPGLSSPDSLGVYLTSAPRVGCMDSQRNCISNVRPQGLPYPLAAYKLAWLIRAGRGSGTGVALKDGSAAEQGWLDLQNRLVAATAQAG
ncbi:ethanolamine ammonia-lyase subunit EutC [Aquitalea magnusonii]|uniref:Ethanolamine ammonia-lyase small subunit n=1 Tax=Aquitalea magnusonii TaxID=332411 RepID=A0A318JQ57_9NEIS|nr:ethanolamine ammonia-lyase subunit EutC [Aquitalea magnusonii]PXX50705.1 ethanolamine ammonia-lyase light chain [Aquitalea magnusonii]